MIIIYFHIYIYIYIYSNDDPLFSAQQTQFMVIWHENDMQIMKNDDAPHLKAFLHLRQDLSKELSG